MRQRVPQSQQDDWVEAVSLFQEGRIREARRACHRVLQIQPDFAEAWHLFGLLSFQLGDAKAAVAEIGKATQLSPGYAGAYNDLGNVLCELARYSDAAAAYRRALELSPADGKLHSNLGSVLRQLGLVEEAVAHCEKALDLEPNDVQARYLLARALRDGGRFDEAAEQFYGVLAADPERVDIQRQLCTVLKRAGRREEALRACEKWLEHDPDDPVARHMLAALSGDGAPSRASEAYIRRVFDEFASRFDSDLQQLGYQGPHVLAVALAARFDQPRRELDILDAGCGTGLCAGTLRPYAKSLAGVDLSSEMLARAEKLDVYDELIEAELTGFLRSKCDRYDLIVACDTFNYFGDLRPPLESAAGALRPAGMLMFTAECSHDLSALSFQLESTGRYSHTPAYLEAVLETSRLALDSVSRVRLRMESGQPVNAMLVQARRP